VAAIGIFSISAWYGQAIVAGLLLPILAGLTANAGKTRWSLRILLVFLPLTFGIHILFGTHLLATVLRGAVRDSWQVLFFRPLGFTLRIGNFILLMALATQWIQALPALDAIYHILKPLRRTGLPIDDLFQIIFIAVRFIPLMREEYQRIAESWRIFMDTGQDTLIGRIDRLRTILVPLMIVSFRRAEVLADAMTVRGYNPAVRRSYLGQLHWSPADWVLTVAGIGVLVITVGWV